MPDREMTPDERRESELGFRIEELIASGSLDWLDARIRSLKDGAMNSVLSGLDPDKYREKIGFIRALDIVLGMPGELVERGATVRDSL